MQFSVSIAHFLAWVSFLVLLATASSFSSKSLLVCQPQDQQPVNPRRHADFLRAMSPVSELITERKLWVESSLTDVSPPIYVFLQCREDLSASDCRSCFSESKSELERTCLSSNSGRIHSDGCFLRFDNRDFSEEFVDPRFDRARCEGTGSSGVGEFWKDLDEAFVNVTLKAVRNGGFGAGGSPSVYALAQCWQTLDENSCRDCLVNARSSLRACGGHEARAFFTGCYVKYSTHKFFDDAAERKPDEDQESFIHSSFLPDLSTQDVMKLGFALISLSLLTSLGAYISYTRFSRKRKAEIPSCLNFKYEMLEKATESFHDSMKLGQGGAGSVYKGILPDGRTVAVKKLFFNTREWADQFFNEVNLISGVQHKNLVRLLGCSIEGPKSLLVYEYVHNRSLDQILFSDGYLAPEYLIKGQLTEKADVYAFGVLVIEIATGKKNNAFTQGTSSVLYSVWEHFKANTLNRSIDPRLEGKFTEEEALKVLEMGLLCVQSSVELRPSMSEIVLMLKNKDCKFECPKQPPFLSASVLMPDEETRV
ncbi:unnamed protein product [Thlaspi arvense]|uniref:Cysteine-rich receptor-like protein kinase 42 n=1 Tax=Thlaspi arvense TaxID=13288 RepID=A0AAU9RE05_THLAR|nr:unnamed protein product [Thlaspi arvense]